MKNKKIILAAVLVFGIALLFIFLGNQTPSQKTVHVENSSPVFEVIDALTGKKISSSDLKGKVVFFNVWATWCPPCQEELPAIDALYKSLKSNADFVMVTVLYRDNPSNAIEYLKSKGFSIPVYTDPDEKSAASFGVTGVPETYIIDKKGNVRKRVIGAADWNSAEEKNLISTLLNE